MDEGLRKDEWKEMNWIERIRLDRKVEAEMEGMRSDILEEIHRRIGTEGEKHRRRIVLMKRWAVAAAVVVLAGLAGWSVWQSQERVPEIVTLACAEGMTSETVLPDGTHVCLNGGTILTYDAAAFGKELRRVELQGEAFFDVSRNEQVPFVVHSAEVQVRVLGTRFNVESYPEESLTRVTLESGKVSMSADAAGECLLMPDQQAVYDRTERKLSRRAVDASDAMAWMTGRMVFNDVPLEEVARKLSRRFRMHFVIRDEGLKQGHYNGCFEPEEGWQRILSLLSTMDSQLTYRAEGDTVWFCRKE